MVRGAQDMAGEIDHVKVSGKDTPCWCGNVGCLDTVAGAGVLASELAACGLPCSSAKDVTALAAAGVPDALKRCGRRPRYRSGTVSNNQPAKPQCDQFLGVILQRPTSHFSLVCERPSISVPYRLQPRTCSSSAPTSVTTREQSARPRWSSREC